MMDEENQADAWLKKQGGKAAKGCCVWALGLLVPAAPLPSYRDLRGTTGDRPVFRFFHSGKLPERPFWK